eukprot:7351687-Prymnesium_polylepis.2
MAWPSAPWKTSGICTLSASCVASCVLPIPGTPANSVSCCGCTPPPSSTSSSGTNVTILTQRRSSCNRSSADDDGSARAALVPWPRTWRSRRAASSCETPMSSASSAADTPSRSATTEKPARPSRESDEGGSGSDAKSTRSAARGDMAVKTQKPTWSSRLHALHKVLPEYARGVLQR